MTTSPAGGAAVSSLICPSFQPSMGFYYIPTRAGPAAVFHGHLPLPHGVVALPQDMDKKPELAQGTQILTQRQLRSPMQSSGSGHMTTAWDVGPTGKADIIQPCADQPWHLLPGKL